MSRTTSVVPEVKARLVEMLATAPELEDQVAVSWAEDPKRKREAIWFGRTNGTSDIAHMRSGRKSRDETVTMTLIIDTGIPGRSAEDAERRCFELWAVVENLLADDIALTGAHADDTPTLARIRGVLSVTVTSWRAGPDPEIEGWSGLLVADITVTARLN